MARIGSRIDHIPKYKLHKSSGHAFVTIAGRNHFLGRHGTPESRERYNRLLAEWLSGNGQSGADAAVAPVRAGSVHSAVVGVTAALPNGAGGTTITELIAAYKQHAEATYPPATVWVIKSAVRTLRSLYGSTPVAEFTPKRMKAVQRAMAEATEDDGTTKRFCRNTVNDYTARLRGMMKWGVAEGLVPAPVWQALLAVPGLRRNHKVARESEPVGPVPDSAIDATLPHLSPVVADIVRVQRLTGARPGEVCRLTSDQIDTSGPVWLYRPREHKTQHHDKTRAIAIGPRAQAVLMPYLGAAPGVPVFSPLEAERLRHERERRERATRVQPSQAARADRARLHLRRRPPGKAYTASSYRVAVARACKRAGVAVWSPNQLRHSRATELRRSHGLDVAGAVLGHTKLETTQIYAERNLEIAAAAALATG